MNPAEGSSVPTRRKSGYAIAVLLAMVLAVAGCTAGSGSPTPGASTSPGAGRSAGASAAAKARAVYRAYTGGPGGAAGKAVPVTIGYLGEQGDPHAPGALASNGAQAAVSFINQQLGGIDGHPLKLDTCFVTARQSATAKQSAATCAGKFVAAKGLPLVADGVPAGGQSFFTTIAGKIPVIDGQAVTPYDATARNTVILFGDPTHVLGAIGSYATQVLGATTASVIYPQTSEATSGAAAVAAGLKTAGVQVTMAPYPAGDTKLAPVLASAHAATAGLVVPYADAAHCATLARALTQQGITGAKKIVSGPLCLTPAVAQSLGGDFPKWTYSIASSLFGDPTDAGIPDYQTVVHQYTTWADAADPWEIVDFAQMLTIAKLLNQVGYAGISPAAVLTAARAFRGPQVLGAPLLHCGQFATAPAVCNTRAQFFAYQGSGRFTKLAGWTGPPAS
jgi:branched-chain amino acid transport system substrate-binding protein